MIAVTRSQKHAILARKEQVWLAALRRAVTDAEKENAVNKYRHAQIKDALESLFYGKCAYCESKIKQVAYPQIEHYRPKSKFPDLTFEWENLLLACSVCNSTEHKGNNFPAASDKGPYINPCIDNPEEHFQFVYNATAKLASVYGKMERGKTTEIDLRLNRPDLRTHRSMQMKRLAFIALKAKTDSSARRLLDEAKQDDAEYAAFTRNL